MNLKNLNILFIPLVLGCVLFCIINIIYDIIIFGSKTVKLKYNLVNYSSTSCIPYNNASTYNLGNILMFSLFPTIVNSLILFGALYYANTHQKIEELLVDSYTFIP